MKLESCKIALCISGQPRYLEDGYQNIKSELLDKYDIDVFVHTWFDENDIGKEFTISPALKYNRTCKLERDTIKKILTLYKPKLIKHESNKQFNILDADYGLCIPNSVHSMLYSIKESNTLKCRYENDNEFLYDVVIRCRFDITIENFNFVDLDLSKYYVSGEIHRSGQTNVPNDQFCLSSSKNMDLYSNLFDSLEEYKNSGFNLFVGEQLLKHHLLDVNKKEFDFCSDGPFINIIKNR